MQCPECGKEVEIRPENGKFIAGCWSLSHDTPNIEGLEDSSDECWPICGLPSKTPQEALESFISFWTPQHTTQQ